MNLPSIWPFKRKEKRQAGYSSLLLAGLEARAQVGSGRDVLGTAAYEAGTGFVARALASAESSHMALTPDVLSYAGRALMREGEAVFVVDVRAGKIMLTPSSDFYVYGDSPHPDTWRYRVTRYGPSGSRTDTLPATTIIHIRYAVEGSRPWLGIAPWQFAQLSSRAAAAAENVAGNRAAASHGSLIFVPEFDSEADDDEAISAFRADIAGAKGKLLATESPDFSESGSAGHTYPVQDFGLGMKDAMDATEKAAIRILSTIGVSPSLAFGTTDGTAMREAYRRAQHSLIAPICRLIEHEASIKLETPVTLDLTGLMASDVAGRARSYKALVDSGMEADAAMRIVGMEMTNDRR